MLYCITSRNLIEDGNYLFAIFKEVRISDMLSRLIGLGAKDYDPPLPEITEIVFVAFFENTEARKKGESIYDEN